MFSNEVTKHGTAQFYSGYAGRQGPYFVCHGQTLLSGAAQTIYELCYQDDKLSYFDVSVAVPQMVQSGHLQQLPDDTYVITDKGREHEEITCDAIAYPVMQRALMAVQRYNTRMQRKGLIETRLSRRKQGTISTAMPARRMPGRFL